LQPKDIFYKIINKEITMKLFKRVISRKQALIAVSVGCVIGLGVFLYNQFCPKASEPKPETPAVEGAINASSGAGKFDPKWLEDDEPKKKQVPIHYEPGVLLVAGQKVFDAKCVSCHNEKVAPGNMKIARPFLTGVRPFHKVSPNILLTEEEEKQLSVFFDVILEAFGD